MKKSNKLKIKQIIKESIVEARPSKVRRGGSYATITWGDLVRAVAENYAEYGEGAIEGGIENDLMQLDTYDIEGLFGVLNSAGFDTEDAIDFVIKSILK